MSKESLLRAECELLVEPLDLETGRKALAAAKQRTLWQMLTDSAAAKPDHAALVGGDDSGKISRITYKELVERATGLSAGLASIGVRRGDRVVLWMTNSIEWVVSAFAVLRLGAALVPVNTFLKPEEIRYFVTQSGARHMIMLDSFRKLDMPATLKEFCPAAAAATEPGHLCDPEVPDLRNVVLWSRSGGKLACAYDFAELEATADADAVALADRLAQAVTPGDLAMVKYTSGSTSFPKGVMLEHGGFVANGVLHAKRMPATGDDVYFSSMPLFHAGGSIYGLTSMLVTGGTLVFTEAFNPDQAVDLLAQEKATMMVTLLGEEIAQAAIARGISFPDLRLAGLSPDMQAKVAPNVDRAFAAFGLTETYAPCSLMGYKPGGNGKAGMMLDGNEGKIVDPETGLEQPRGVPGELLVRGNTARGYWNKPEETAKAFDKDGWFHSEDLVSMDEDGFLTWHGRLKLMLKVGGENVSLEEVERVVESHDCVLQCGAVGVRDKRKTEAVATYVVRAQGKDVSTDELRGWLDTRLARFKMPREIVFVDELPRLGNGKLNRRDLAARAEAEFPVVTGELSDFAVFEAYPDEMIDHDNIDHYRAMAGRRLVIRHCRDCGYWVYPHRPICPECLSWNVPFEEVGGRGRVFMETRLHQLRDPKAQIYEPLVAAAVELEERPGLRYLARIVNCELDDIRLDMPVTLTWIEEDGITWPAFEPAASPAVAGA